MLAAQANAASQSLESKSAATPIKLERRDSSTSESSLEHLDLGRTPKKLNSHSSATSTPHVVGGTNNSNSKQLSSATINNTTPATTTEISASSATDEGLEAPTVLLRAQQRLHDSDEANDYDEDESADEQTKQSNAARAQRHHKRRSTSGRLDKRTSVHLEYNADNPNSLRKKFRFNRSTSEQSTQLNSLANNESGFVDASCSSQYLNASATMVAAQLHTTSPRNSSSACSAASASATASHSSSASSSPHGAGGTSSSPHGAGATSSISSPESGIGEREREDMKFVCTICEVVSATRHEFTNHIRCHNYASGDTENFTCAICLKMLSSASSLDRHVLVHTGERPFNCKYCHLTFTTNGNMHRHMRTHKQHQHNHHHRRNSNGTKNNAGRNGNSNHNNSANSNCHSAATPAAAAANSTIGTYTQLSNGVIGDEGVKAASAATTMAGLSAIDAAIVAAAAAAAASEAAGVNGKRLNGSGVESYESDGGCSTDSSSAISHSSNNHKNNHNNNNNDNSNNHHNNNNNNNNNMKANNNNNTSGNCKRKNSDLVDADDIALLKRRMKTTINNNIIGADDVTGADESAMADGVVTTDVNAAADATTLSVEAHAPVCPVCNAEFADMRELSAHMDGDHADIPAKCRHCDVVFRSHRQLNAHPCTQRPSKVVAEKDLPFGGILNYACACGRTYTSYDELEAHAHECLESDAADDAFSSRTKQRSLSESSRSDLFRLLYLKTKPLHVQSTNSLPSPQSPHSSHSHLDEAMEESAIKQEVDVERMSQHFLSQQSHDSKDLADIQSILNMTSSSSTSNFLKNFEQSVNTPSSNYSLDKDEEEAQDVFTAEFRKMKLRGEFPCKLCTAVFPNLRALKGHNRFHLSAAGPAGPFRCNMCPYSICDKAALVRHMRTHNGDRPYECAECNYAFTTKANCERHLRNRHGKTTREEVKRSIIYHPSEDSSCDDPAKKLHMFSSPDFDDDIELQYQQHHPKDRSTPVSHLKEMLTGESPTTKPIKIQVKSLEQLLDKSAGSTNSYNEAFDERHAPPVRLPDTAPIDLSMDVLDLSKKPTSRPAEQNINPTARAPTPPAVPLTVDTDNRTTINALPDPSKFYLPTTDKNPQLSAAHELQLAMPKYFKDLYESMLFPTLNPFFLQNAIMPDMHAKLSRMFAGADTTPNAAMPTINDVNKANLSAASNGVPPMLPQVSAFMPDKPGGHSLGFPSPGQIMSKSLASPGGPPNSNATLGMPRHPHIPPTVLPGGPVKMVIKNGVLMPKQKQRRYRTERPFACEHCSARFTLRSNMERHVKQQHPQYYAQRQRSGHHIMRGRGASSAAAMNNITHLQAAITQAHNNSNNSANHNGNGAGSSLISEQVKYAILAQHLKARKDTDLLQQALAHGSSSVTSNQLLLGAAAAGAGLAPMPPNGHHFNFNHLNQPNANGSVMEDDEPKLIIDEDDDDDVEEIPDDDNEDEEEEEEPQADMDDEVTENVAENQLPTPVEEVKSKPSSETNEVAKKVAETILEQAIKASGPKNSTTDSAKALAKPETPAPPGPAAPPNPAAPANTMKSMIAQAESVGKFLKEVASSPFKDESQDLVPVSKLVDNATSNAVSFNNYFRRSDVANHMEQSDEEGLVASGSASESNNSGTEDVATAAEPKKKSAYSLAPNRVSCPYCQRMFPWSSSLRRHILTHTGQKPFKCSHCPLLFTTKSNCDRHLLRKHGNVESAVSVYVPTEDVTEPIPVPKSVEEIEQQQRQREEEERKRKAEEAQAERERREKAQQRLLQQEQEQQQQLLSQLATVQRLQQINAAISGANGAKSADLNAISSAELPYKCHLCECSFSYRFLCVEHIKRTHAQEFELLLSKGALDTDAESNQAYHIEEEERRASEESGCTTRSGAGGGKYPDYSNRKVICAFCMRRFWSTEDLRRHMRTHSGERPFQCEICLRKFTLKHSMLRHMKKHNGRHHNGGTADDLSAAGNSGSDFSDDEQMPTPTATPAPAAAGPSPVSALPTPKIQELLSKANEWRTSRMGEQKENIADEHNNHQSDLIGNLLGISDQGILNKLLSSADEAAKLLGIDK